MESGELVSREAQVLGPDEASPAARTCDLKLTNLELPSRRTPWPKCGVRVGQLEGMNGAADGTGDARTVAGALGSCGRTVWGKASYCPERGVALGEQPEVSITDNMPDPIQGGFWAAE